MVSLCELEPIPGIIIDRDARLFMVNGLPMMIGVLERQPYRPEYMRCRADYNADTIEFLREQSPRFFTRPSPEMPEVVHANLLCGENGWWVEASVYYEGNGYGAGMYVHVPGEQFCAEDRTADELLATWRATCLRRDASPYKADGTEPGPFAGQEPGTWAWNE